jgi:hypothetical protein
MSDQKHTPGPWDVNDELGSEIWVTGPDRTAPVICDIVPRDPDEYLAEDEANAALIAAAPELLAVARMVTAASMGETRPSRGESFIGWQRGDGADADTIRKAARAAISKALGENQP